MSWLPMEKKWLSRAAASLSAARSVHDVKFAQPWLGTVQAKMIAAGSVGQGTIVFHEGGALAIFVQSIGQSDLVEPPRCLRGSE